jgi:hypothetical protein
VGVAAYLVGVVSQGVSGLLASRSEWAYSNRRQTPDAFAATGTRLLSVVNEAQEQLRRRLDDPGQRPQGRAEHASGIVTWSDEHSARRSRELNALDVAGTASPLWLAGVLAVGAVFYQGVLQIGDSRKLIADAVAMGRVDSPAEKRFRDAVNRWLEEVPEDERAPGP